MMTFTKTETVEIDEEILADDLKDFLYEVIGYQDRDFAEEIEDSEDSKYKLEILAMLNKVGEIWHKEYLQYILGDEYKGVQR